MGAPRPSSPATTPCAVPISAIEGEEMQGFLHQLLSGVADGGIYASLALALVMIYQATHHVNFAQGAMAMFSTFIAWAMIDAGFPYWAPFGLTLVSSFAADVAIEQIIIRLVERGPVRNIVMVFIGLLLILNSLAGWISGKWKIRALWLPTFPLKAYPVNPKSALQLPRSTRSFTALAEKWKTASRRRSRTSLPIAPVRAGWPPINSGCGSRLSLISWSRCCGPRCCAAPIWPPLPSARSGSSFSRLVPASRSVADAFIWS